MKRSLTFAAAILAYPLFSCHPRTSKGVHTPPQADECGGMCGEGTRCVQEQCRVDYSKDVCGIAWRAAQETSPMSSPIRNWGECNKREQLSAKFVPLDDSEIPTCDAAITQHVDMADLEEGNEKLSDEVLKSHMREVEYSINECLATAACYSGEPLSQGSISLRFRVEKTGTVAAVTCDVSEKLDVYGVVPCTRKAVAAYRFPSFNGPTMTVNYQINLE